MTRDAGAGAEAEAELEVVRVWRDVRMVIPAKEIATLCHRCSF